MMTSEAFMTFKNYSPNPQFPEVVDVDPQDVLTHAAELVLIDVRRPDEYTGELGHVAGTTLLTLDQLPSQLQTLPKNKNIVFICRSGGRSAQAAAFALENGFNDVYNMKGGMLLWNEYGLTTEK
jgi:rhodanese-related sulfurtransferase